MKIGYIAMLAALGFFSASCATQSASTRTTDDIYYSSGDAQTTTTETITTTTPESTDYSTYPGNSDNYEYAKEPETTDGYRMSGADLGSESYTDDEGNTYITNNYYDDYYGYDDYHYTSSINRFYSPYYGFSYYSPYYSPYYYSPYYDPWGWNIGISFGWGHSCYPYGYYDPWYGYGYYPYGYHPYGYYDPWYGYGYGYGYGYNSYWNGYHDGYYDGYYGSGYGYGGGYYGYDDGNYYYGPNTGTGSNTNTGDASSVMLTDVYDKSTNVEQAHMVGDKSKLGLGKDEVNIAAAGSDLNTVVSPESVSVKGGLEGGDAVALEESVVKPTKSVGTMANAASESKANSDVRVIKYYKPEVSTPVSNTNTVASEMPAKSGSSVMQKSGMQVQADVRAQDIYFDRPTKDVYTSGQGNTYQSKGNAQKQGSQYSKPQYESPKVTQPSKTYNTYEQPSRPSINTYEKPKSGSSSSSSSSKSTWNSGSSSKSNSSWSGSSTSGSRSSNSNSGNSGNSTHKRGGGK